MSSSRFDDKKRVAHVASASNTNNLQQQLIFKKQNLALMAARINSPNKKSLVTFNPNGAKRAPQPPPPKKARKRTSSEEDADFLDDEEEGVDEMSESDEGEEEEDMGMSDDDSVRKRKKAAGAIAAARALQAKKKERTLSEESDDGAHTSNGKGGGQEGGEGTAAKNGGGALHEKQQTLSDSEPEGSGKKGDWMAKPRMLTTKGARFASGEKKKHKKIAISSSDEEVIDYEEDFFSKPKKKSGGKKGSEEEDEDFVVGDDVGEEGEEEEEDSMIVVRKPATGAAAAAQRNKRIESSPEYRPSSASSAEAAKKKKKQQQKKAKEAAEKLKKKARGSDSEEDLSGSGEDAREESDSDASDGDHVSSATRALRATAVDFFNTATHASLLNAPRIVDKIADHIVSTRPFTDYDALIASLLTMPRVQGRAIVDAYIEHLLNRGVLEQILDDCNKQSNKVVAETSVKDVELPLLTQGLSLHEYQQEGVDWLVEMYNKSLNCILADEMGLGKTIQVIAFLSWMKKEQVRGPHLIVVPSSTVENWMAELRRWCPAIKFITYYGNQEERRDIRHKAKKKKEQVDVLLTTYNMIGSKSDDRKFFKNFSINYVVYDEGHMLKNCGTERYKSLMKIKTQRKILLTGTPLQNNLIELISLMYFTIPKVFNRYCDDVAQLLQHFKQQRPALEGSDALLYQKDRIEQAKAILQPYILRRVKAQVLSKLPPKSEEVIEVELAEEQRDLYDDVVDGLRKWNSDDTNNAYGGLMRLRQAANHPLLRRRLFDDPTLMKMAKLLVAKEKAYAKKKQEYVAEDLEALSDFQLHQLCEKFSCIAKYQLGGEEALKSGKLAYLDEKLPEIKKKGDKVLIFSQFTSMLDILEVYLRLRGHSFCRLDGSTPVLDRQEMINGYNSNKDLFVFLLSTKAGGLGINLVAANHIILHDIDFNPYNDKQAEDRCHRMGQTKPVYVTRLISKDTIEVDMHRLARKKLQLERDVTKGSRGLQEEEEEGEEEEQHKEAEEEQRTRDSDEPAVSGAEASQLLTEFMQRSPPKKRRDTVDEEENGALKKEESSSPRKSASSSPTKKKRKH